MEGPVFIENISDSFSVSSGITQVYHTRKSKFQTIHVVETIPWGKCLILDGHLQSSERDEFVYHENLVHPVLLSHPNPKTVFIGGGGEGSTLREILRHKTVEKVVMVDIDAECVDVSKKFLVHHHAGAYEDPRVHVIIDDAKAWLENNDEKFDIIVQDLCDPVDDTPSQLLYTQKYYETCKSRLNPGGSLVTQGGPAGVTSHSMVFTAIHCTLASVFPRVQSWKTAIPSYVDEWGWSIASTNADFDVANMSAAQIDKLIEERIKNGAEALKWYDGEIHSGMYKLPKNIRKTLEAEKRVITEDNLLFIP